MFKTSVVYLIIGLVLSLLCRVDAAGVPIIQTISIKESIVIVSVNTIDPVTKITLDTFDCEITSNINNIVQCTPPKEFFRLGSFEVKVENQNGMTTLDALYQNLINSYASDSSKQGIFKGSFEISNTVKIYGIDSTPISIYSWTDETLSFKYPDTIKCGYAFLMDSGDRQSNDILFCPNPFIASFSVTNNLLRLVAQYLQPTPLDTFLLFVLYPGDSTEYPCTSAPNGFGQLNVDCSLQQSKRVYSFNAYYVNTGRSLTFPLYNNPSISSVVPTAYGHPGRVTVFGQNLTPKIGDITVQIGSGDCSIISVATDKIVCLFQSDIPDPSPNSLTVSVIIDTLYVAHRDIFEYSCPRDDNGLYCSSHGYCQLSTLTCGCDKYWDSFDCSIIYPQLTSISSTHYGEPSFVTIKGDSFYNSKLNITIGGSPCSSPVVVDPTTIVCMFQSNVQQNAQLDPLVVFLSIETKNTVEKPLFSYSCRVGSNGKICSGHGLCKDNMACVCDKGWGSTVDCSTISPNIISSTSTKFGSPSNVTISGDNFAPIDLKVKIGGLFCTDPVVSDDLKTIICYFQSNVTVASINDALEVYVSIQDTFIDRKNVFLYFKATQSCPIGSNGQVCSGNGDCDQKNLYCKCVKGWLSSDCSVKDTGIVIDEPNVNENDTSTTITTPTGTKFDVGLVMVNELKQNGDLFVSYDTSKINWNSITNQQHQYSTLLPNNSTLQVKLTINSLDQQTYYNFAGDTLPILPKSIKYQIELSNWTFDNSLNNIEFVFKSGVTSDSGCEKETNTVATNGDDSQLRSIQITMNGEILIGTFSNRIILDNRPSYNKVEKLSDQQLKNYKLNTADIIYTSILTSHFKNNVVVDPNFGVLIQSAPDTCSNNDMPTWKLAVIIVCSVIGASIIAAVIVMLLKKNNKVRAVAFKLKLRNRL